MHLNDIPNPRTESLILCAATIILTALQHITHAQINLWLASVAGCMSITHYVITFYKAHKRKNENRTRGH